MANVSCLKSCTVQVKERLAADVHGFASATEENVEALVSEHRDKCRNKTYIVMRCEDGVKEAQWDIENLQKELKECEKLDCALADEWKKGSGRDTND